MSGIYYVTGGARSGKSAFAEKIASQYKTVGYIATGVAIDDEMKKRIDIHKQDRPQEWTTFECYNNIDDIIKNNDCEAFLLDCLTIMTTNKMMEKTIDGEKLDFDMEKEIENNVTREIMNMVVAAKEQNKTLIVVSNEVGMGIVPDSRLSRSFRDIAGRANQLMASLSDRAYLLVSSIPLKIKG
jgi:adenosylcobinamide kinase / adenosylcobinamide-phosphate guanylyltransferase